MPAQEVSYNLAFGRPRRFGRWRRTKKIDDTLDADQEPQKWHFAFDDITNFLSYRVLQKVPNVLVDFACRSTGVAQLSFPELLPYLFCIR